MPSPVAALFRASKTIPEGNAPSPITATECRSGWPVSSSPARRPRAVEGAQPAWPVMNRSKGLSEGFGYPISPPLVRIVWIESARPVISLWG